ncbi:MAG: acyltransferase [Ruminococcus sp.]|nr:acyltransferase [Ruminococcus sp.]
MSKTKPTIAAKGYSLSALSTTRDLLFGLATLMIIIFHSYVNINTAMPNHPVLAGILSLIRYHGNKGVDMFLFMSGIGLYYSMSSNPRLRDFYKKRATRILPAVFIVSFIWFAFDTPAGINGYFEDVFFVSFFTRGVRNFWYFILMIFLYAIYPLIHKFFKSTGVIGAITSVVVVVALNFVLMETAPLFYSRIEIALTRIPVFLLGAFAGKYVKEGKKISWAWIVLSAIGIIGIYIFYHFEPFVELVYLYRYIGGVFAICHLFLFSAIFSKWRMGALGTFLVWLGGYSMEIYLIHEKAAVIFNKSFHTSDSSGIVYYIAIFFITVIFAMALKAICQNLDKNLFYKNDSKKAKKTN